MVVHSSHISSGVASSDAKKKLVSVTTGAGTLVFASSIRQPIGMETTKNGWTILDADQAVLSREYSFTPGALARTIVARQHEGELLIMSPPNDLDDAALSDLEQFGKVTSIIANNGMHHMGLPLLAGAFPEAKIYAPQEAIARIAKKQPVLRELRPLSDLMTELTGATRVHSVPGFSIGEAWVTVKTAAGPIWYVGDSCFSMAELPSKFFPRQLFKWAKCAPGLRINSIGNLFFLKDKPNYKNWMLEQLREELPIMLTTAHGEILTSQEIGRSFQQLVEAKL